MMQLYTTSPRILQLQATPEAPTSGKVLKDVILAKAGEAKGHGVHVDQEFINTAAAWFNENKPNGLKCNMGHNYENVGKTIGKFHNIRVLNDSLMGDLHIYDNADSSPIIPGAGSWLTAMAEEDEEAVMCSLVFSVSEYYQKTDSGQKIKVYYWDEDDNWISPSKELGHVYVGFGEGRSCDIVGDGALTEKLFSTREQLVDQLIRLQHHPEFRIILETHGDKFPIMAEHYSTKTDKGILAQIKKLFTNHQPQETPTMESTTPTPEIQAYSTNTVETPAQDNAVLDQLKKLTALVESQAQEIAELKAELEAPAAEHTEEASMSSGPANKSAEPLWMQNPINQRKIHSIAG